jgi:hypothetical protein
MLLVLDILSFVLPTLCYTLPSCLIDDVFLPCLDSDLYSVSPVNSFVYAYLHVISNSSVSFFSFLINLEQMPQNP